MMVGDRVFLSDPGNTSDEPIEYEGYIHEVHCLTEWFHYSLVCN